MTFAIKAMRSVRNHWKKSAFATCVLMYAGNWLKERYEIDSIMKVYCEEALTYGKETIEVNVLPRKITVILNPAANKRSSLNDYEKYCSPILNLAGICIDVIHTESEGHAKQLVQELTTTDAVIVAGGDGTLSEVVTGLIRRIGEENSLLVPIGVLPLGQSNTVGLALFPGGQRLAKVRSMAEASIAIVREVTKPMDVMKIEVLADAEEADEKKNAVYALSGIEWGAFRDASVSRDKYWYYGPLKKYATYIFNGYKDNLNWECNALIEYSQPCAGCSNCVSKPRESRKRWYNTFLPSKPTIADRSMIVNDDCKRFVKKQIATADFTCLTSNISQLGALEASPPKLHLSLGPSNVDYLQFLREGFRREAGQQRNVTETIEARQIQLRPNMNKVGAENAWFSIDKDNFEIKPVKITLLPKTIKMFCNANNAASMKEVIR